MFGFVFGSLCLVLLVKAVRHARHGWHGHHGWRGRGGPGGWRRYALYGLFERLDATPGQEKVIAGAMDELRETMKGLRAKFQTSRSEAASAMRQDALGEEDVNRVFSHFDAHLDELRKATGAAMQKIHDALDPQQRGILADLIERGGVMGGGFRHHGCGRGYGMAA
jgi:Spy/CpxP family protein refolding chaperone